MDLAGSEGVISAIGGAVASAVASIATMGRRFARRVEVIEKKLAALKAAEELCNTKVDGLERLISAGALRNEINEQISRALAKRDRISQRELAPEAGMRRDLDRLERELREARSIADAATPGGVFAEHLGSEADRWNEVHRALGQIEGSLTLIRGKIRDR